MSLPDNNSGGAPGKAMSKDSTSPFSPGRPVPLEFFVGREGEVKRLQRKVQNSFAQGRIDVAFVAGERGIGKSSLASFVRYLCEKHDGALGIHAFLGGVNSVQGAVKKIFDNLLKVSSEGSLFESVKGLFGKHIREFGLFGISVEFAADERELDTLANSFAPVLRNLVKRLPENKRGIVLILDDVNGLARSPEFANWLKSLVDEIATARDPLPLSVFLVGLDERRLELIQSQPSLARVLEPIDIREWTNEESTGFFGDMFHKANLDVDANALTTMARYSGGFPVLAHEIGDAVFLADSDSRIDENDAATGIWAAADIVGRRYLDPLVYSSIRSERYRTILRRMALELSNPRFTRAEIRATLAKTELNVFDSFLRKMKKLGVVIEDSEGGRGSYRFRNLLHYLYFSMEALQAEGH